MDGEMTELSGKIDALTAQVAYLTQQAQAAERERGERAELMHDLVPIANEALGLATAQLEEVQEYVDLGDLLRLLKRLLRNGRNIEQMLDQLESVLDLVRTLGPLSDEAFGKAVDVMQEAERKGYFAFAASGMKVADNIVTSFTQEDVKALGNNVVLILNTVKDMTQPEIMRLVRSIVADAEVEVARPVNTSLPAAPRPDARSERPPRPGAHPARAASRRRTGEREQISESANERMSESPD